MHRYFSYYLRILKLSLMTEMAHRGNLLVWVFVHSATIISMFIFFKLVYLNTSQINGWTQYQSLLVMGTGTLIGGLGSLTFFPFVYKFGEQIRKGDFDLTLTKPLDTHFISAICWVDIEDFIILPNSLAIIFYSLYHLNPTNLPVNLSLYLLLIVSSLIILFSTLTLLQSLAFKQVNVSSVMHLYWSIVNITKYPAKALKNVSLIAAITLFPIALISSVPSEVLFGRFDWPWILSSLVVSLGLLFISRKIFTSSLRDYSSASS